jgi:8-oxo-dGTP diphosphatase
MITKTHLGVYGLIVEAGKVLLVGKTRGPYKSKLDLPGGKIEHGELIEKALDREVLEETGFIIHSSKHLINTTLCIEYFDEENATMISLHHIGLIYSVTLAPHRYAYKAIDFEDVSGMGWYDLNRLEDHLVTPFALTALHRTI